MWSRVTQILWSRRIQHRRVQGAAAWVLLLRLLEGAPSWVVVDHYFSGITVPAWVVHLSFAGYALANPALYIPQRRTGLTPALVWIDILANLLPMAAAAHWTGGVYSPLLPIFVLKIGSYGLIYGVDSGVESLLAALLMAGGLAVIDQAGSAPRQSIASLPMLVRGRLTLGVAGLFFWTGVLGSFRFFKLLSERESRLKEVSQELNRLYQQSLRHQQDLRRLSRHMIHASERTMRMLARELHDD